MAEFLIRCCCRSAPARRRMDLVDVDGGERTVRGYSERAQRNRNDGKDESPSTHNAFARVCTHFSLRATTSSSQRPVCEQEVK